MKRVLVATATLGLLFLPSAHAWTDDGDEFYYALIEEGILAAQGSRTYAAPFCADMDDDGDLDCLVGTEDGPVNYYQNDGSAEAYDFTFTANDIFDNARVGNGRYSAPFCADLDNDGDLDCVVGGFDDDDVTCVYYFRNDGDKTSFDFTMASENVVDRDLLGWRPKPALADMDNDGDLDLIVSNDYYRNDGDNTYFNYTKVTDDFVGYEDTGHGSGSYLCPFAGDIDNDGDIDILLGSFYGQVDYFQNDGDATSYGFSLVSDDIMPYEFVLDFVGSRAAHSCPFCADFTNDGILDCVMGDHDGKLQYFEKRDGAYGADDDDDDFEWADDMKKKKKTDDDGMGLMAVIVIIVVVCLIIAASVGAFMYCRSRDKTEVMPSAMAVEIGSSVQVARKAPVVATTSEATPAISDAVVLNN